MQVFQDYYLENLVYCYGCGCNNVDGYQIKIFWDGDEIVMYFQLCFEYMVIFGFVYGGLLVLLIDCYCIGIVVVVMYWEENCSMDSLLVFCFVIGLFQVSYLKLMLFGLFFEICGKVKEIKGCKVVVEVMVYVEGEVMVCGEVVVLQMLDSFVVK